MHLCFFFFSLCFFSGEGVDWGSSARGLASCFLFLCLFFSFGARTLGPASCTPSSLLWEMCRTVSAGLFPLLWWGGGVHYVMRSWSSRRSSLIGGRGLFLKLGTPDKEFPVSLWVFLPAICPVLSALSLFNLMFFWRQSCSAAWLVSQTGTTVMSFVRALTPSSSSMASLSLAEIPPELVLCQRVSFSTLVYQRLSTYCFQHLKAHAKNHSWHEPQKRLVP